MKITSCIITYTARGPRLPQFKFNDLFNEHFLQLIFFLKSILSRKNWQGRGELLLKNITIDGYAINHVIGRTEPDLHCLKPLALWRFSQHLLAKYKWRQKKVLPFKHGAPGTVTSGKSSYCITFIKTFIKPSSYCITFIKKLDEGLIKQPLE